GSGALPGFVDTIVELRRFAPDDHADRRRVLTVYSRLDDAAAGETVLELGDDGYVIVGAKADVQRADRMDEIARLLPTKGAGLTAEEVRQALREPKPGLTTLRGQLNAGANAGRWSRFGFGIKGSAFRYFGVPEFDSGKPLPIGAGIESGA